MTTDSETADATANGSAPATQELPPVELGKAGKRLQREAAKAQLRQTIAESQTAVVAAQRDMLETALPAVDTKPLEGDIKVGDGVGIISDRIAYSLVSRAADHVASLVEKKLKRHHGGARLLVVEDRDLVASDWAFEFASKELEASKQALGEAKAALAVALPAYVEEAPQSTNEDETEFFVAPSGETLNLLAASAGPIGAGLTLGEGLLGGAADLAAFFQSDYSLAAKEVKLGTTPLTASICSQLAEANFPVEVDRFARLDDTGVISEFEQALELRMGVKRLVSILKAQIVDPNTRKVEALEAELADTSKAMNEHKEAAQRKKDEAKITGLRRRIADAENAGGAAAGVVASAEALVQGFDALAEKLTTVPASGGLTPLATAAIRERLHGGVNGYTHVLYASVESSGGESIVRKSIWPWLNVMTFLGGAQLSYLLVDVSTNAIKAAGTDSLLGTVKLKLSSAQADPLCRVVLDPAPGVKPWIPNVMGDPAH